MDRRDSVCCPLIDDSARSGWLRVCDWGRLCGSCGLPLDQLFFALTAGKRSLGAAEQSSVRKEVMEVVSHGHRRMFMGAPS